MNVANDPDDGDPWAIRIVALVKSLSNRVFAGPEVSGHRLVDQGNRLRVCAIALIESAAVNEFHAERPHVAGADETNVGNQLMSGRWRRMTFKPDGRSSSRVC